MNTADHLTRLLLLRDQPPGAAQDLSIEAGERQLLAGEVVFRPGIPDPSLYIVASGKVCIHLQQAGSSTHLIEELGPGECMERLQGVTLLAAEDTRLLCVSKTTLDRLVEDEPALVGELAQHLLVRFQRVQSSLVLINLFGPMDDLALHALRDSLEWRHLDCGDTLCRQCEPGDEMYIVVQGRMRFALEEEEGSRDLGEVGAGESIGEFALLAERDTLESQRSATVYAIRPTDLIVISRPVFEDLLRRQPQVLLRLTRRILQREIRITQTPLPGATSRVITVLPLHSGLPVGDFAGQLAKALYDQGSTLRLNPERFEQLYERRGASETRLDRTAGLLVDAWMDGQEREHRHVVYEAALPLDSTGRLTPWAQRCVARADVILLVGDGGGDPARAAVEAALLEVQTGAQLELVLLHPGDCAMPSGTAAWLAARGASACSLRAHHHVRLGNAADLRRLSHRLTDAPVGLALGGGGARGWAHVGAIRALTEAGIDIDCVGGASMGAIIAAGYALDWSVERLCGLATSFSNPKKLLDYTFPYTALTATKRITTLLRALCGDTRIEDTWRPYFCISANLTHGREQVHTSGLLWEAVRASLAFPAIFAPMLDNGCVLIDGGAVNNLPIDRMREMCPTGTVIGVDVNTSSPSNHSYEFGPSLSGWHLLAARLNPFAPAIKAPSMLDIVAGLVYSSNYYRLNETRNCADLLIEVPVEAYGLLEFHKYAEIIEAGYAAATEQLESFLKHKGGEPG